MRAKSMSAEHEIDHVAVQICFSYKSPGYVPLQTRTYLFPHYDFNQRLNTYDPTRTSHLDIFHSPCASHPIIHIFSFKQHFLPALSLKLKRLPIITKKNNLAHIPTIFTMAHIPDTSTPSSAHTCHNAPNLDNPQDAHDTFSQPD